MVTKHTQIAATEGMRAGYRAYQRKLRAGSGLPQVAEKAEQFVGNPGFKLYCSTFGADVDALKGTPARTSRVSRFTRRTPQAQVAAPVATQDDGSIEWLKAEIARREAAAQAQVAPATTSTRENLWRAWAVRKYGIPTKVGGSFVYTSKKSKKSSTHKVVRVTAEGVYTVKVA